MFATELPWERVSKRSGLPQVLKTTSDDPVGHPAGPYCINRPLGLPRRVSTLALL